MKHQQHHQRQRGRGRKPGGGGNGGGGHNNPGRSLESTGPDIKVRGTASNIYEKYLQLARDANASGDRIRAESFLQHAEHYFRILRAMHPTYQPQMTAEQRYDQRFGDGGDFEDDDGATVEALASERADAEGAPGEGEQPPVQGYEGERPPQAEGQRYEGQRGDDDFRRGRRGRRGRFRPEGEGRFEGEGGEFREARDYREHREEGAPREERVREDRPRDDRPREERPREERMEREPRPYREPRPPREPRQPREQREQTEPSEGFADSPKPAFLAGD